MLYPEEIIEEVQMKNDIVDVLSGYIRLTKKGRSYFGLCPFHNEKTPSFSVVPEKQMYYCFGCGAGGNVITFLMEYENYTFLEALKILADRAGVKLPEAELSDREKKVRDEKTSLLKINKLAAQYYFHQLKATGGKNAYDYLRGRGLEDATIVRFGLGYSHPYRDDLYQYIKKKGYPDEMLKETGLFRIEEKGITDKFWNRVMFPIMDVNSRVIGFGGRVMGAGEPKYLNSPETKLFDKSRNLYGLNFARSARRNYMLICEGYMDVIAMHQAGFTNAVASLGTAFTPGQANLLKRYTSQVILTYDSDAAGTKAALRAISILKDVGLSVKVLNLLPFKDPDEFIKNSGKEAFEKRVEEAENAFLFEISVLSRSYPMEDPEQKTRFYDEVVKKLIQFPDELERNNYIEAVARKYMVSEATLRKKVNAEGNRIGLVQPQIPRRTEKKAPVKDDGLRQSWQLILTWLIDIPGLYGKVRQVLSPDDFSDGLYRRIAGLVFKGLSEGNLNPAEILNHFINDEEEYKEVAKIINKHIYSLDTKEEREKAFSEALRRVKSNSLTIAANKETNMDALQKLIKERTELKHLHISLD